jgi:hypothetical protein
VLGDTFAAEKLLATRATNSCFPVRMNQTSAS